MKKIDARFVSRRAWDDAREILLLKSVCIEEPIFLIQLTKWVCSGNQCVLF
jgi:hypothetical protein